MIHLRNHPTLYASLATLLALGAASACGSLDSRDFSGDPSDVGNQGGASGDGDVGGDGDGDGDVGGNGDGDGDGDMSAGGAGGAPPVIVDEPPPNPGCDPPETVSALNLQQSFPPPFRSAAGADVIYEFSALSKECAVIECRLTQGPKSTGDWTECGKVGDDPTKVRPFTDVQSQDEMMNGSYLIEMRERFEGAAGPIFSRNAYIHNSMHGVNRCPALPATVAQMLGTADLVFKSRSANSTKSPIMSARVNNPFIQFDFAPPVQNVYSVSAANGQVEYLSLRRHFTLNNAGTIVLMTRAYESRRIAQWAPTDEAKCYASTMRTHNGPLEDFESYACDAVAMNSQGFGLCLQVDAEGVITPAPGNAPTQISAVSFYSGVDHFMWSRLDGETQNGGKDLVHFSPKCFDNPMTCEDGELFLPHRSTVLP